MKLFLLSYFLTCLFAVAVVSVAAPKAVIVSYPKNTPDYILDQAIKVIIETGGVVSHKFTLFQGFAAKVSAKGIEAVNALSTEYLPVVEEDSIVSIDGDLIPGGHTE